MSGSSQRSIIVNEDDDVKASVSDRGLKGALAVEILDASGDQITDFSGGSNASVGTIDVANPSSGTYIAGNNGGVLTGVVVDSSGHLQVDVLSGASGGTQYTEGDAESSIVGTAILWEDASNVLRAVSATKPLPVEVTDASVAVTGTFWQETQPVSIAGTVTVDLGGNNDVSLNTGTNVVGKVRLVDSGGTEITEVTDHSVNVTLVADDVGIGGGTQYTLGTDTYTETTSIGTLAGAVRNDTLATLVNTDNEIAPLQVNASGALYIQEGSALNVSAATVTVESTDLDIRSLSSASDSILIYGSDDGGTTKRVIETDAGGAIAIQDGGNTISVDGTVTANLSATDNAVLDAIAAGYATEGDALGDGVLIQGDDGTDRTNVLVDADGHLQVDVLSGGGGGTQYAVDAALGATPTGTLAIAIRDDALSGLTPAEGDAVGLRVDENGSLWVSLGTKLDNTNDSILVYANTAADGSGTDYVPLVDASGHLQIDVLSAPTTAVTGTFWQETQPVSIADTVTVDLGANNDVTITSGTVTTVSTLTGGGVAHDSADSGNPVKIGGRVEKTDVTEMADGDRSDSIYDEFGRQKMVFGARLTYASIDKTSTASQDVVAASASHHHRVYGYTISNEGTEQVTVTITSVGKFNVKDGSSINYVLPGYIDLATNTAIAATLSATSTNGIIIGAYYQTMAD